MFQKAILKKVEDKKEEQKEAHFTDNQNKLDNYIKEMHPNKAEFKIQYKRDANQQKVNAPKS